MHILKKKIVVNKKGKERQKRKEKKNSGYATPRTRQRSISNSFKVGPMGFIDVVIVYLVGVGGTCNFQSSPGPRVRFNAETNQVDRDEEQT